MRIAGVDEAGRGPVIGPMVIACVVCNDQALEKIKGLGVKDSKLLNPKKREELARQIKRFAKVFTEVIQPAAIDKAVQSKTSNLNVLEAERTALLLARAKPDTAIVDCPSNNKPAYKKLLEKLLKQHTDKQITLIFEHKAERHAIVAAASIIAKTLRDRLVQNLKKRLGVNFGSGYPSDPLTQEFIKTLHGDESFVRRSWSSIE
ncbi:ribonuclease HII, partial [Candidatus Woesearchaeota archaeon]|nr:ribonuclease HII [Candidatus Woesearchaeota archaeon]